MDILKAFVQGAAERFRACAPAGAPHEAEAVPTSIALTGGRNTRRVQLQHGKFTYSLDASDLCLGELLGRAHLTGGLAEVRVKLSTGAHLAELEAPGAAGLPRQPAGARLTSRHTLDVATCFRGEDSDDMNFRVGASFSLALSNPEVRWREGAGNCSYQGMRCSEPLLRTALELGNRSGTVMAGLRGAWRNGREDGEAAGGAAADTICGASSMELFVAHRVSKSTRVGVAFGLINPNLSLTVSHDL